MSYVPERLTTKNRLLIVRSRFIYARNLDNELKYPQSALP
jgi:hypothetical protein